MISKDTLKNPYVKYGLIIGGVYLGYKAVKALISSSATSAAESDINKLKGKGMVASYPDAVYTNIADSIEQACLGFGTDEQLIYQNFGLMKNDLDVAKLIVAYGTRRIEFSLQMGTLSQLLSSELDSSEISEINSILAKKGITYRF